ncbi:MAG: D-alanyl-D-alanine carboxypeptidase family protein [Bacillota bacterium]
MTRKTLIVFLSLIFLITAVAPVFAYAGEKVAGEEVLFPYSPASAGGAQKISVTADAAVVMDVDTGQVLFQKNAHQKRPIASTTKIMTALLAIECGRLSETAIVSPHAAGVEGSSIYLQAGERLTLEELLYGALMHSGNDACVAIAEQVAGNDKIFVNWMNARANQMGLKNTHFSNTNGLPDKEHLSSAYDLAVVSRYALKNEVFRRIVSSKSHTIKGPAGQRRLFNTNQLLWSYSGANGVKTGTTSAAGKCLVSSASRDGRQLVAVVLHSDDRYGDSIKLLNYGFKNFINKKAVAAGETLSTLAVKNGVKDSAPAVCPDEVLVTVPVAGPDRIEKIVMRENEITAPVKKGNVVGRLLILDNGRPLAEKNIVVRDNVEKLPWYKAALRAVPLMLSEFTQYKPFQGR